MAEILVRYTGLVQHDNGTSYRAQAGGAVGSDGLWEGWIEFIGANGEALRSPRETTQPNHNALVYWAEGLSTAYLEGALRRALHALLEPNASVPLPEASIFSGPAAKPAVVPPPVRPVLDPFATHAQGEHVLRQQLTALSRDHLLAIISGYALPVEAESVTTDRELVDEIVKAVHQLSNAAHGV
ncbi:MAG: hypothetical protein ABI889_11880 [Gemmatimonadota bacterium]